MMYLSKQFTIPIRTPGTIPTIPCSNPRLYDANNHQPNRTPGTFLNHPQSQSQSQSIHEVPFQAIHNLIPHAGYLRTPFQTIHNPNSYTRYLSKLSTFLFRTPGTNNSLFHTPGTFPIQSPSQSVHKIPCQAIHNPNPYARYQTKPL
jgi:hypothetical protein